ncbi:unnamed protein product [Rhizophagus irregularis]|nr:unnamed protein product [Rhizophagus irregularis]
MKYYSFLGIDETGIYGKSDRDTGLLGTKIWILGGESNNFLKTKSALEREIDDFLEIKLTLVSQCCIFTFGIFAFVNLFN